MTETEYNQSVNLYADNVYRFILKNLKHTEDARDLVQSAYESLWVNRTGVDFSTCKSYLFTIAYRKMIDHIRKNKRISYKDDFQSDTRAASPSGHTSRILNEALGKLSETQRSLVLLKDYEGYSYEEIGKITGLNESQVKVYLHRARLQLRDYIVHPSNVIG